MKLVPLIPTSLLLGSAALGFVIQFFPAVDLFASGLFYQQGMGFTLAQNQVLTFLHALATTGSRVLGGALCLLLLVAAFRKSVWNVPARTWLFLLGMLFIGPGLVANVLLKDHWGRARPREVSAFGGSLPFTPPLSPQPGARSNGSFVAGDAAFGFFLPCFAVIPPVLPPIILPPTISPLLAQAKGPSRRRSRVPSWIWSRWIFWAGMAMGAVFGYTRLAMGAHFLSDVIFAMLAMLAVMAVLQTAFFGKRATLQYWRCWLGGMVQQEGGMRPGSLPPASAGGSP